MQHRDVKTGIRLAMRGGAAAAMALCVACAGEPEHEPNGEPQADVAAATGAAPAGTAPAPVASAAHAPHFEPAALQLPKLPAVPARLPANAEDTGRYNVKKPKEIIAHPAPLPLGPTDVPLSRRQQDYLARWKEQEATMRGATAEAVEATREALKAKVVGE